MTSQERIPVLSILALAANPHMSGAGMRLTRWLEGHPRCKGLTVEFHPGSATSPAKEYALQLLKLHAPDTLIIVVHEYWYPIQEFGALSSATAELVENVRRQFPKVCIVLDFGDENLR